MGHDDKHRLAFLTSKSNGVSEVAVRQVVACYEPDLIRYFADVAELMVAGFPADLRIEPLRERRLTDELKPHPKGLKQRKNPGERGR